MPWVDHKVKKALRQKHKAYNRARKSDTPEDWETFRSLRKFVNRLTRSKHRKYIRDTCATSTKKFWTSIKSQKNDSFGIPTLKINGQLITDNIMKANALNNQFESVFTQEDYVLPNIDKQHCHQMPDVNITVEGVEKLLTELDPGKATGPDGVPARILKMGAKEIAPALTTIFRLSLESGNLPNDWRCANISPIFKKGDAPSLPTIDQFHSRLYAAR
ncbi:uncharacterized protein [Amphiura filiformis]|uniref:uncharacterized protein n=1 Tax=Amphiura filiformis TaxID=82378 RepID=UPI003B2233C8